MYELDALDYETEAMLSEIGSELGSAVLVGAVFGNVPNILILIGVWILFGTAVKKDNLCPSAAGLTLCKVASVINMVCVIVGLGLSILVALALMIAGAGGANTGDYYAYGSTVTVWGTVIGIIFGVLFVILAGVLVFNIIYYVKLLRTIKTIRHTIETDVPRADVSRFITFMCFFSGCVSALSSLIIFDIGGMAYAAASIIFGVILIKYKKQMIYIRDKGNTTAEADAEIPAGNIQ